jgi:hypothetical protein
MQNHDQSDDDRNFGDYVCSASGLVALAGLPHLD